MWYIIIFIILIFVIATIYVRTRKKGIKYILDFFDELEEIKKDYINYSLLVNVKEKYKNIFNYKFFLIKNKDYDKFKKLYNNLKKDSKKYNAEYIKRELINQKEYFDNLFSYPLDEEQRKAILTDEDNNLIIASAGSGKTSTIVAKTKYLIEKKKINPSEIIAISFTNNAVNNFKEKISNNQVASYTFHKLASNILNSNKMEFKIDNDLLYNVTNKYITKNIINDEEELKKILELIFIYVHIPYSEEEKSLGEKIEYEKGFVATPLSTMAKNITYIKSLDGDYKKLLDFVEKQKYNEKVYDVLKPHLKDEKKLYEEIKRLFKVNMVTLNNERVKSQEELIIANYLYLHGIKYEYEKVYEHNSGMKKYTPDFYLPEYNIYLEHFGINKDGHAPQYSKIEEQKYIENIEWKRKLHILNNTKLIETYSWQFKERTIIEDLEQILKKNGITIKKINYKKLYQDIIEYIYFSELIELENLIIKFIKMFKSNKYEKEQFDVFIKDSEDKKDVRSNYLLNLFKKIYILYLEAQKNSGKIDLEDLLIDATKLVSNGFYNEKVKYIIVDEYQDIALSRFDLIKEIQNVTGCKIVAVGDDWQSIFRFSGCDLEMFINFEKYLPHHEKLFINSTHRNSQELIDIASNFIMKNEKGQLMKKPQSSLSLEKPITLIYYNQDILKATIKAVEELNKKGCKKIAILGRNNSDLKYYIKDYNPNKIVPYDLSKIFKCDVTFLTVHKSKGLEYDGIIVCNMRNAISGFPNKMSDDPVLHYVTISEDDYLYEEERRLFYVALTRTKSYCYLLVPHINESIFVDELRKDNKDKLSTYISEKDEYENAPICPKCKKGKLLIRKNNTDGREFISCMNYPKCDYRSKYIDIVKNPIKCTNCDDFLVKKDGFYGEFYGCNNYPYCHQTMDIEDENQKDE